MCKTILITGATDGIGKATAELLAADGHEIIIHARSVKKGERAASEIQQNTGFLPKYIIADFRDFSEISEIISELKRNYIKIDVLINNAGVYRSEKNILDNGLEETFMVNYLAHFYLSIQLIPLLEKSKHARIINVSSLVHASHIDFNNLQGELFYDGSYAYSQSKLCNLLFSNKLAIYLKQKKITVNALHPGVIRTKLLETGWGAMGENPKNSAKRLAFLAEDSVLNEVTGKYFANNSQKDSAPVSNQKDIMEQLWNISSKLIAQNGF